jgi:hypothetical protein
MLRIIWQSMRCAGLRLLTAPWLRLRRRSDGDGPFLPKSVTEN